MRFHGRIHPHTPDFNREKTELLRVVRIRTTLGDSARDIAEQLGVAQRSVVRYRTRLRTDGPTWKAV